jgi:hypothetical protein
VTAAFEGEQLLPLGNRRPGETRNRDAARRTVQAAHDLDEFDRLPPPLPRRDDFDRLEPRRDDPLPHEPAPRDDFSWFVAAAGLDHDLPSDEAINLSDELDARRWSAGPEAHADADIGGPPGAAGEASGYRSKHRLDGPANDARPQDGRKSKARHAGPGPRAGSSLACELGSRQTRLSAPSGWPGTA